MGGSGEFRTRLLVISLERGPTPPTLSLQDAPCIRYCKSYCYNAEFQSVITKKKSWPLTYLFQLPLLDQVVLCRIFPFCCIKFKNEFSCSCAPDGSLRRRYWCIFRSLKEIFTYQISVEKGEPKMSSTGYNPLLSLLGLSVHGTG